MSDTNLLEYQPEQKIHTFDDPVFIYIKQTPMDQIVCMAIVSAEHLSKSVDAKSRLSKFRNGEFMYVEAVGINEILHNPMNDLYRAFRRLQRPNMRLNMLMGLHDNVADCLISLFSGVNIMVIRDDKDFEALARPAAYPDFKPVFEVYSLVSKYVDKDTIKEETQNEK